MKPEETKKKSLRYGDSQWEGEGVMEKYDGDLLYIGNMKSYPVLERMFEELEWEEISYSPIQSWISEERLALLIFELISFPDDDENFPFGKWSAIQYLQNLLSSHMKKKCDALKGVKNDTRRT